MQTREQAALGWFGSALGLLGLGVPLALDDRLLDSVRLIGVVLSFTGTMCLGISAAIFFQPEKREDARTVVDITPAYLLGLFKNHTHLEARKLVEPYLRTWMRLSGTVENIDSGSLRLAEYQLSSDGGYTLLYFAERWKDRLAVIRPGESVTVLGKIDEVRPYCVVLVTCELV